MQQQRCSLSSNSQRDCRHPYLELGLLVRQKVAAARSDPESLQRGAILRPLTEDNVTAGCRVDRLIAVDRCSERGGEGRRMFVISTDGDLQHSRGPSASEYETDSFEIIQSSPNPLAGDPDPVQSGLVDQKPIQSNPIRLVRTAQIFVHCIKCNLRTLIHLLPSFMNMSVDFATRNPSKRYMF